MTVQEMPSKSLHNLVCVLQTVHTQYLTGHNKKTERKKLFKIEAGLHLQTCNPRRSTVQVFQQTLYLQSCRSSAPIQQLARRAGRQTWAGPRWNLMWSVCAHCLRYKGWSLSKMNSCRKFVENLHVTK